MTTLVDHARRELAAIGEDPETAAGILKVIEAFSRLKLAAETTSEAIQTLNTLLEFQHLAPLTDDPEEWYEHDHAEGSVWQNKRNGEAFSHDGGKTYYLLSEGAHDKNREPLHNSHDHQSLQLGAATWS
jgi:hypothetical protein